KANSDGDDTLNMTKIYCAFRDIADRLNPYQVLRIIATLFPDRVEVLDEAWKSAEESNQFRHNAKLFDLLWKLVTTYRDTLLSGKADETAREVFGKDTYAAHETESTKNNKRARQQRTFHY